MLWPLSPRKAKMAMTSKGYICVFAPDEPYHGNSRQLSPTAPSKRVFDSTWKIRWLFMFLTGNCFFKGTGKSKLATRDWGKAVAGSS
jgi:hypothetical protein